MKRVKDRYTKIFGDYDVRGVVGKELNSTLVESMVKVQVWYDNEFGYSRRLLDSIERLPF